MAEKGFWGLKKISWKTTGVQNLVYHPLIILAIFLPSMIVVALAGVPFHPAVWTWTVAGMLSGIYHEWTQADAGAGRPNMLERILDVLGHTWSPPAIWSGVFAVMWAIEKWG